MVPVIVAVDKTQLSMHHGDASAWPVYVTIGNISREARRRRTTTRTLLAGFIPIVDVKGGSVKSQIYHYAMGQIFKRGLL